MTTAVEDYICCCCEKKAAASVGGEDVWIEVKANMGAAVNKMCCIDCWIKAEVSTEIYRKIRR